HRKKCGGGRPSSLSLSPATKGALQGCVDLGLGPYAQHLCRWFSAFLCRLFLVRAFRRALQIAVGLLSVRRRRRAPGGVGGRGVAARGWWTAAPHGQTGGGLFLLTT